MAKLHSKFSPTLDRWFAHIYIVTSTRSNGFASQTTYLPIWTSFERRKTSKPMKETELVMASSTLRVVELRRAARHEDYVAVRLMFSSVLYTIDLTCYDRYLDDTERTNELQERLTYLKAIVSIHILLHEHYLARAHQRQCIQGTNWGSRQCEPILVTILAVTMSMLQPKYILKRCTASSTNRICHYYLAYLTDLDKREADAMDQFFRQSAASITAVSWLREIGLGTS